MFVLSQSSGSFPVSMDAWKMVAIAGASWGAQVFNIMLAIWSGPWALDVLIPRSSFLTPSTVMRSAGISCLALFLVSGRWLLLSLVKTNWNCSTIICAFSLLALISCPIFFKGGGVHKRYLDVWIWHISRMVWSCSHQVLFEWHHWCGWSGTLEGLFAVFLEWLE